MTFREVFELACSAENKWGLYVSFVSDQDWKEVVQATGDLLVQGPKPFVDAGDVNMNVLFNESGYFFYDSEKEARVSFDQVVGDEGPTGANPYKGPGNVYAELYSPVEGLVTTNS